MGLLMASLWTTFLNATTCIREWHVCMGTRMFVDDPIRDWNEKGVTYIAFDMSARVLKNSNGLSSRTISGSSGPTPLCNDPLTNDANGSATSCHVQCRRWS